MPVSMPSVLSERPLVSHYWDLECMACSDSIRDSVNRGHDELVEAAENAWALHLAVEAGWDVQSADRGEGRLRVGSFVAEHAKCNAFKVSSEYGDPPAFPKVKDLDYRPCQLCADRGVVPCPCCRPDQLARLERDSEMMRKQRKARSEK